MFTFTVERPAKWSPLGLHYTGLEETSMPLVITAITPGGIIAKANEEQERRSERCRILKPGDIILFVNTCSKELNGSSDMRITLMVDRRLVFQIQRYDNILCDASWLTTDVPCMEPQGGCEVVQQEVVHTTCNHTRANAVRTNDMERLIYVDPLTVRFTHDRISSKFRDGNSLDYTIEQLLRRELSKDDIPPIEVSLVAMAGRRYGQKGE